MNFSKQSRARLLSSSILFNFRNIDIVENVFETEEPARPLKRVILNHRGAVVFMPQQSDGRLVMVRQFRHAVREDLLEFPAGTLEKGESPIDCAKREICEEVNLCAEEWFDLGYIYSTPGFCNERLYCFMARNLRPQAGTPDEDEELAVVTLGVPEVAEKIKLGEITDAKSIALFLRAKLNGLI